MGTGASAEQAKEKIAGASAEELTACVAELDEESRKKIATALGAGGSSGPIDVSGLTKVATDMTNKHRCEVKFHCTGYGPYQGAPVNPTQTLMEILPKYLEDNPLPQGIYSSGYDIFEVAGQGIGAAFPKINNRCSMAAVEPQEQQKAGEPEPDSGVQKRASVVAVGFMQTQAAWDRDDKIRVWLHFGAAKPTETHFTIETMAVNEATFPYPDMSGWHPEHVAIVEKAALGERLFTTIDYETVAKNLQASGFDARPNAETQADWFCCNYLYYHSLHRSSHEKSHSVFVHMPQPHNMPVEDQLKFVRQFMIDVAQTLVTPVVIS